MIRGESVVNPPLIMLHGGPGLSETALFRHFNAALEKHFTVVYWDQRGAGKSYARTIPDATMTVEQFLSDLDELVGAVRVRLGHRKVTIFGHSWGSTLGTLYTARFPDKVAAYASGGQMGDCAAAEAASYAYAVATAERRGNEKVLRKLRAIGPPPYSAKAVFTERTCVQRLDGQMTLRTLLSMARLAVEGPEASIVDVPNTLRGFRWTLDVMWPEVSTLNLLERAPVLRVPVFFFLGRTHRAVEAVPLVRELRARDVHGRAGEVQSHDDRAGPAARRERGSGAGIRRCAERGCRESTGGGRRSGLVGNERPGTAHTDTLERAGPREVLIAPRAA
jgi:pimeloyl-ACP methyl ester carboxylesterase